MIPGKQVSAQDIPDAKVRYLSAGTVYLDRGSNSGIMSGDQWEIVRNGQVIAKIEVIYLSTASASCKIVSQAKDIQTGDVARWTGRTAETVKQDTVVEDRARTVPVKQQIEKPLASMTRVSGVVSAQWYHRTDNSAAALDFDQWNARLSMRIRNMWTPGLHLSINTRARFDRRQYAFSNETPEEEWRNRLYWVALSWEPDDAPLHFQAGRIASNKFSGMGYLDGLIAQHNLSRTFYWGIFGGVQPDMQSVSFSTNVQKYGLYGTYHTDKYADRYLQATLALAGSYRDGKINREYAYFEFRMTERSGLRINHSMEIDYNRDWRKSYAESTIDITSLYLSASYKFNEMITAGLGYDNRRNYLTYVYYSKPQELFHEAQRQSLRGDVQVRFPIDMSVTVRGGLRKGREDSQASYNYGLSLIQSNLLLKGLQVSLTYNGFRTLYNRGHSPGAALRYFSGTLSAGASYGAYMYNLFATDQDRINRYLNLNLTLPVWQRIYFMGNYYFDWGDDMQGHRVLTEFGYRL